MGSSRSPGLQMHSAISTGVLAKWFPVPETLYPRSAGIDISDASIKWLALAHQNENEPLVSWGEEPLAEGIVVSGIVQNVEALSVALKDVKKKLGGIQFAHAALPEEAAYVFNMHVPVGSRRENVLNMIEFEFGGRVPIAPGAAVYDFDVIMQQDDGVGEEIGVVVFPRDLAEAYAEAFRTAGIQLLSLEVEARSIARAISVDSVDEPITLLVDFGRTRTGFAVLKRGIPIFTSTVAVGGATMTRLLVEKMSLEPAAAEEFKNEKGLHAALGSEKSLEAEALLTTASALAEEVARHFHYWDTRRNEQGERVTPVGRVFLVGGSANLKGLPDYIAAKVQAPTTHPNVWQHVCSFDTYIPPIDRRESLQYATAIGLALRGV